MPNQEVNKFVILAMPRTGSTLLTSTLNTHADIRCHGEIFRVNIKKIQGPVKVLNQVESKFLDDTYRRDNPFEFLEHVFSLEERVSAIGFKLMLFQHRIVMRKIIQEQEDFKIILLRRDNVLSVYSSDKIAKATGQSIAGKKSVVKTAQVEFDVESFEAFWQDYEHEYHETKQLLESVNREYLEIEYNDLRSHQGFKKVLEFVNVSPEKRMNTFSQKRNSDLITERFSNPEIVSDYLQSKGLEKWLTEE